MNIMVLNQKFEVVYIVDNYESFIWTDRYREYGDFELYFAMDPNLFNYFKQDYYLWNQDSEHCMIIEDLKTESDIENGDHLIITGRSLETILSRRIIWGQQVFEGSLQDAIQTMLNDNIIAPSIEERKIPNFIFSPSTDTNITSLTIDAQYTGDNIYEVIKTLCTDNHIGFKIVLSDNNEFIFSLYAGTNRSYEQDVNPYVIFSPKFDNIINSNYYSSNASYKNVAYVAGEGEGSSQKSAIVGSASGLDRREIYVSADNTSSDSESISSAKYAAQLQTKGEETLAKNQISIAFEGEIDTTRMYKYQKDFFVGDTVQIVNEYGNEGVVYISELVFSHDKDGISIYPTFKTFTEEEE